MLHGQTRYNIQSRFLDEIPGKFLKWINPSTEKSFHFNHPNVNTPTKAKAKSIDKKVDIFRQQLPVGKQWQIGQTVIHAKFGEGVIIDYEGSGTDVRVQVNFNRAGTKWLMLEYAKLTPV